MHASEKEKIPWLISFNFTNMLMNPITNNEILKNESSKLVEKFPHLSISKWKWLIVILLVEY